MKKLKPFLGVQKCPYCQEECITFSKRVRASSIWTYPECPECGVTLVMSKNFRRIRFIVLIVAVVLYVILTLATELNNIAGWTMSLILVKLILDYIGAAYATLDYEDDWKHPKPPPAEMETGDIQEQETQ